MMKNLISRLTMVKLGQSFYDKVQDKPVYYWRDYYFDRYMATSRWGFRIKLESLQTLTLFKYGTDND